MREFQALQADAATLFAATILVIVFFLVARVCGARQPIALAVALFPTLALQAAVGLLGA